ncbi:hypothetical protein [Novosphingobium jiangmenense]|uniref:Uncharacterized protein n=1 Tax=Novosphingobium jiangmenense TaxID=2791981 RepID=A0ABS0HJU4_9SPHN|nr:hypothetical protein [Novosphingobium jiangmenense]MBF9152521.1 hypothetical protein [Novosphingobium jiangmenense]
MAARVAGVSQQTAYVRRRRDPAFAAGWDAALIHAREAAEQVLAARALHGTTETIWFRGEAVGERRRFDARLLLAHLARLDARAAAAPKAVHHLAEDFDHMLLALAGGEDTATATGFANPARERFLAACERQAEQDFKRACPYPTDDEPDEAWDDWQDAHKLYTAEAAQAARQTWATRAAETETRLAALFGYEDEEEREAQAEEAENQSPRHPGRDPGSRLTAPTPEQTAEAPSPPEPCKPRKPLGVLKCGTSAPALLSASFNWPIQAPRQLPATQLPLPPAPAQPWLAAATGRPW